MTDTLYTEATLAITHLLPTAEQKNGTLLCGCKANLFPGFERNWKW